MLTGCHQTDLTEIPNQLGGKLTFKTDDQLVNGEEVPIFETLDMIERFVVNVYDRAKSSNISSLTGLHWHVFLNTNLKKKNYYSEHLKYRIFRTHYLRTHLPLQSLPKFVNYGLENADSVQ